MILRWILNTEFIGTQRLNNIVGESDRYTQIHAAVRNTMHPRGADARRMLVVVVIGTIY